MPRIIALYSPAPGSGKSTIAEHLARKHGFYHLRFADPLKDMLIGLLKHYSTVEEAYCQVHEPGKKELVIPDLGLSPRSLLQTLGTEWGRQLVRQDLWTSILERRARTLFRGSSVVIDDMRFWNELETVRRLNGEAWKIIRQDVFTVKTDHASEGELASATPDAQLLNLSSIEELLSNVDHVLSAPHKESNNV